MSTPSSVSCAISGSAVLHSPASSSTARKPSTWLSWKASLAAAAAVVSALLLLLLLVLVLVLSAAAFCAADAAVAATAVSAAVEERASAPAMRGLRGPWPVCVCC
jgi:hypothetical protein